MLGLNPYETAFLLLVGILLPPLGLILFLIWRNYD